MWCDRAATVKADPALAAMPLALRWRAVKLAIFDVDGVLTDGGLALTPAQAAVSETKRFHVIDGHGVKLVARAGIEVAWISGRDSPVVAARAAELGVRTLRQGTGDKLPAMLELCEQRGIDPAQVLCIGDDLADLRLFPHVAVAVTVPHAPAAVRLAADVVLRAAGGAGAVRELAERLVLAVGRPDLLGEGGA